MKIYTKTGDKGATSLVGGSRVSKDDPRLNAYGDVDELNSWIGYILSVGVPELQTFNFMTWLQSRLFDVGCLLATPAEKGTEISESKFRNAVIHLEDEIDRLYDALPPQTTFILPGGAPSAAALHIARTVCRRAERAIVALPEGTYPLQELVTTFMNRLSDYLFAVARYVNYITGTPELPWEK